MFYTTQNMPKYGLSLISIFPHMDRIAIYGHGFVNTHENADQRKFGIFYAVIVISHHRAFFLVYLVVI